MGSALSWCCYITAGVLLILRLTGTYIIDWAYIIGIGVFPIVLSTFILLITLIVTGVVYFIHKGK